MLREKRAAFEVKLPASNTCRLRTLAFLDDKKLINESSFHHLGLMNQRLIPSKGKNSPRHASAQCHTQLTESLSRLAAGKAVQPRKAFWERASALARQRSERFVLKPNLPSLSILRHLGTLEFSCQVRAAQRINSSIT